MNNINWFPGHMAKGRRIIEEKLKVVDLVIELVDARIPHSSMNPLIAKLTAHKPRILIMSKVDLADPIVTKRWRAYYTAKGYGVVECNLNTFTQKDEIIKKAKESLHAKLAKEKAQGKKERAVRALVIGIPNVGKSTFINKMAQRNAAKVANKAGVTKALQWIKVNNDFELLDTPGLLWPKLTNEQIAVNLALTGAIKNDILLKEDLVFYALKFLNTNYQTAFYQKYHLANMSNDTADIVAALDKIGRDRGCLLKNQVVDYEVVYDIILKEIRNTSITRLSFDLELPQ